MKDAQSVDNETEVVAQYVRTRLQTLNALVTGLITGLLFGLGILVATIFLILKGGEVVGPHLSLLGQYFIGYSVTWSGSFIGLLYGLVTGFILGFSFAWLYNRIAQLREDRLVKREQR